MSHTELAAEKWQMLTLAEQLGNIGSEVHRAATSQGRSAIDFQAAFTRTLELFDLTISDPRHKNRLKEITRTRELFCDAAAAENTYRTTLADLDAYLLHFAISARMNK